jgi:hypothetical protein
LTITKSLSVLCNGVVGGVLAAGTNGITVNDISSGTPGTSVVYLDGLDIDGVGTGGVGVRFLSGASLRVTNSTIRNFKAGSSHGIEFAPSGNATLFVDNVAINNTGNASAGSAIAIRPTAGAATAVISRVNAHRGTFGFAADGSGGGSAINVTVRDSSANAYSNTAMIASSAGVAVGMTIQNSSATNSGTGVAATGTGAAARLGSSIVTGNATGVNVGVTSYKNNEIDGNNTNGTPVPQVNLN